MITSLKITKVDSKSLTVKIVIEVGAGNAIKLIRVNDNVEIQLTNITYEVIEDPEQLNDTITVYHHVRWNGQFHVVEVTLYKEDDAGIIRLMSGGSSNTQDPDTPRILSSSL